MDTKSEPTWRLILDSADELSRTGGSPFTLDTIIKHVQRRDPARNRDSIAPIIQGMTINAPGGPRSACGERLRRVDRGLYELLDPATNSDVGEVEPSEYPSAVGDPIDELRLVYQRRASIEEIDDIIAGRDEVIARYGRTFHPDNLHQLTADEFKSFLLYENNRHWWGIHRHQTAITADMEALRDALRLLLDESKPIEQRLDRIVRGEGASLVRGLGKAVLTPILLVVHPDRYGVWNSIAESAMKRIGIWPAFARGTSFGHRYSIVNRVLIDTAAELGIDLWTLDSLFWGVERMAQTWTGDETTDASPPSLPRLLPSPDPESTAFSLERHLHDFLRDNWDLTELGRDWTLYEEGGDLAGYEYPTSVGRIDLLARHREEPRWLVIELKRAQGSDQTVGQVTRYMGWVRQHLCEADDRVEGLVIAQSGDERMRYALDVVPDVSLKTYEVEFRLSGP